MKTADLLAAYYADPVLFLRTVLGDWFPRKMPWFHRGIIALVLGKGDFLLKFGREIWRDEESAWTEADLDLIREHFVYREDPDDPEGEVLPLFERGPSGQGPRERQGPREGLRLTTSRFMEVILPRGFAKTTLFNGLMVYIICFKIVRYALYLSEAAGHSEQQLANVKSQLEGNDLLLELFGELAPARNDAEKWTGNDIQCLNGVRVQALGRGGQVRGRNDRGARPEIILCDDLEDEESVATEEQRLKVRSWMVKAVQPALPHRGGMLFLLGTILNRESLLMSLARDPDFVTIRLGAMLPSGEALWPQAMTQEEWLRKREAFKRQGLLEGFYMEYQSAIHVDADSRKFKPEEWKQVVRSREDFVSVSMAIDPAISLKKGADASVIAVIGMTPQGVLHVLDMWGVVGATPRDQIDAYFALHFKWEVDLHGVESIAYQAALIHLLTEEMARQSRAFGDRAYFAITPITHGPKKEARIEGVLGPRMAAGYVTFQRRFAKLESEALDWPNGKKDHLDAVAMAITLLDPMASFAGPAEEVRVPARDWEAVLEAHQACP